MSALKDIPHTICPATSVCPVDSTSRHSNQPPCKLRRCPDYCRVAGYSKVCARWVPIQQKDDHKAERVNCLSSFFFRKLITSFLITTTGPGKSRFHSK